MDAPLIWVIDDDESSRDLLARILAARGWHVEALSDGREAIERAAPGHVRAVRRDDVLRLEGPGTQGSSQGPGRGPSRGPGRPDDTGTHVAG